MDRVREQRASRSEEEDLAATWPWIAKALGPIEPLVEVPPRRTARGGVGSVPDDSTAFPTLDQAMALPIEAALARCDGRIEGPGGAVQLLAINPRTLRARMRKLGVDWNLFREGPSQPIRGRR